MSDQKRFRFDSSGVVLRDANVLALVLLLQVVRDQMPSVLLDRPSVMIDATSCTLVSGIFGHI